MKPPDKRVAFFVHLFQFFLRTDSSLLMRVKLEKMKVNYIQISIRI